MAYSLKKCFNCGQWTDGSKNNCSCCGHELDAEYKKEIKDREGKEDVNLPILRINENDPLWLKVLKRPVQVVQLVLYAIIAFLIYLSTSLAH